jgi:MuDR family transposase
MPVSLRETFFTLRHFKDAVEDWAIDDHFEVSCPASEKSHVVYLCRFKATCPFKVRASFNIKKQEAMPL